MNDELGCSRFIRQSESQKSSTTSCLYGFKKQQSVVFEKSQSGGIEKQRSRSGGTLVVLFQGSTYYHPIFYLTCHC